MRRWTLLLSALTVSVVLAGCGDSLATQSGTSRPATTTEARATTPFCEAVQANQDAVRPLGGIAVGGRVEDVAQLVANVRRTNQQVTALAPQEIRGDFDRANQLVERQLVALENSGGDSMAVARDPEIARARSDPEYQAASQRISDYVRSNCDV
ncbi:hypothetical protein AFB00_01690 [Pseudonocardia sp. HH130630-07]|nr:hypothetical protein AFB00_01690 [Pseudonocardia sp. HH130630-07]